MSAAFPVDTATPCCRTPSSSGSSTGTAYAIASRSFTSRIGRSGSRSDTAVASASQCTLVNRATSPVTGPATPMQMASMSLAPVSSRNVWTMSSRLSKSRVAYSRTTAGLGRSTSWRKRPIRVLVPPTSDARSTGVILSIESLESRKAGPQSALLTTTYVRFILASTQHRHVATPSADRPFAGQHVSLVGRLSLLSKRDTRAIVERLGGVFASDLTPRTTIVVTGEEASDVPSHVRRVLSESELCREAGLPDLETLRTRYYSARDLRGMYPVLRDEHLRYLERWGLVRPTAGRYSFQDLHVVKYTAGELERGASLSTILRLLASEQKGQLAFDFHPSRSDRPPARVVSLPAAPPAEMTLFPESRSQQIAAANQSLAAKYFLEGAELDDGEERNLEAAAAAYRRAVLFDPQIVPAIVNLANIH